MNYKRLLILSILGLCAAAVFPQESGIVDYLAGTVNVQHDGEIIELFTDDIGYPLYEYDVISTGENGIVEILLDGVGASGTELTIHENTVFTIETGGQKNVPDTRLKILHGSIGLKVTKLLKGTSLTVQTETTAMGVRGTEFRIATGPDGSVLVVCPEGRVSCTGYDGVTVDAVPGKGVEKIPTQTIQNVDVDPGSEEEFLNSWVQTRREIFRSGAKVFVKAYWRQWARIRPLFVPAYEKLTDKSETLNRFGRLAASDSFVATGNFVKAKTEVASEIIEMRKIFSLYEQVFYRLEELYGYHRQGVGVVALDNTTSSRDFFADFSRNLDTYRSELARVRHLQRMYLYINRAAGSIGDESLIEEFFTDDPLGEGTPGGNPF